MCVLGSSMSKYYVCIHFSMIMLFCCSYPFSKKILFWGYNLALKNPLSAYFCTSFMSEYFTIITNPTDLGSKPTPNNPPTLKVLHLPHCATKIKTMTVFKLFPVMFHMPYVTFFLLLFDNFILIYLAEGLLSTRPTQTSLVINKNCSIEHHAYWACQSKVYGRE